jgi:hypothetical protein
MRMNSRFVKFGGHILLASVLLTAVLQGCVEKGAIVVNCDQNQSSDGPKGCTPQAYSASATGFRSMDGVSPVPANANAVCSAPGSYNCANENQKGCSLLNTNKKCLSYYYYTNNNISGTPNYCECRCAL